MSDDNRTIGWSDLRSGARVPSGRSLTLRMRSEAACLEVEDAFFNHGSAVLLPHLPRAVPAAGMPASFTDDALWEELDTAHPELSPRLRDGRFEPEPFVYRDAGLPSLARALVFARDNDRRLIAFGHADTSGAEDFNERLSEARAQVVVALLVGDRDLFCDAVESFHQPADEAAVLRYAARTRGWDCEVADGADAATPDEVKGFQRGFNEAGLGEELAVDGQVGRKTRGAWLDLFESDIDWFSGGDAEALRGSLQWVDDGRRFISCGEDYPVEEEARDGFRSQTNRRVELVFFSPLEAARLGDEPRKAVYESGSFRPEPIAPESIALEPGSAGERDVPDFETDAADPPPPGVGEPEDELVTEAPSPEFAHEDAWDFLEAFDQALPRLEREDAGGIGPRTSI